MPSTLADLASTYRDRFPDLSVKEDGDDLRIDWRPSPSQDCLTVFAFCSEGGALCLEYIGNVVQFDADALTVLIVGMTRELEHAGELSAFRASTPSANTFGELVLRRLRPSIGFASPDQLN